MSISSSLQECVLLRLSRLPPPFSPKGAKKRLAIRRAVLMFDVCNRYEYDVVDNPNLTIKCVKRCMRVFTRASLSDVSAIVPSTKLSPLHSAHGDVDQKSLIDNYLAMSGYLCVCIFSIKNKKSLKIPKGQPDSVYRRRTDNTMAKRKSTKGQTTIYKTYI